MRRALRLLMQTWQQPALEICLDGVSCRGGLVIGDDGSWQWADLVLRPEPASLIPTNPAAGGSSLPAAKPPSVPHHQSSRLSPDRTS
jgi:hypothetical protein